MIGQSKYKDINALLQKKLDEKQILIAVHRGSAAGNIIENTVPAYQAALALGGDILESDVIESTDGVLYNFHNGMEEKNFGKKFDIRTLSSKEIDKLVFRNSNAEATNYPVERLENTLQAFKGETLINLDRAWDFFPELTAAIDKAEMQKQVLLKGPLNEEVITFLQKSETKYMFMPKIATLEELHFLLQLTDINIVGVELKVETEQDDFFQEAYIQLIQNAKLFIWVNALTIDDNKKLFATYDDNMSILEAGKGWLTIFEKGANIIQTDWPSLVANYRTAFLNKREKDQ